MKHQEQERLKDKKAKHTEKESQTCWRKLDLRNDGKPLEWGASERREWLRVQHCERGNMWTGPWDTHVPVGESQAAGVEEGSEGNPRLWWWSIFVLEGREDFILYLPMFLNTWSIRWDSQWCKQQEKLTRETANSYPWLQTSLGTGGFLCGRGMDCGEQRAREKEATSVSNSRPFFLGGTQWTISSVKEPCAFVMLFKKIFFQISVAFWGADEIDCLLVTCCRVIFLPGGWFYSQGKWVLFL